jgi:hypothetical protein
VARELRVSPQKLYWWRRRLRVDEKASEPRFMEVKVATQAQPKPFGVQTRSGHTIAVWPGSMRANCGGCWQRWRTRNAEPVILGA